MRARLYKWADEKMTLAYFGAWYPAWPFEAMAMALICCGHRV